MVNVLFFNLNLVFYKISLYWLCISVYYLCKNNTSANYTNVIKHVKKMIFLSGYWYLPWDTSITWYRVMFFKNNINNLFYVWRYVNKKYRFSTTNIKYLMNVRRFSYLTLSNLICNLINFQTMSLYQLLFSMFNSVLLIPNLNRSI